jgi:dienelactone hydrolase
MNTLLRTTVLLPALAILAAHATWAQRVVIEPGPSVLAGEPMRIVLEGFAPGREVHLVAERDVRDATGLRPYRSQARFVADAQGRVDLGRQAPEPGGSYGGADVRGPLWSMVPASAGPGDPASAAASAPPRTNQVRFEARQGERSATATLVLEPHRHDVVQRAATAALPGAVYAHLPTSAPTRRPALILLGGSEGGRRIVRDAPVYASRGYAVLALPYYSPPGWGPNGPTPAELPELPAAFADIPLERLEAAREWLAAQPEVDASRIGIVGTSKGAEFALLAAVRMPWLKAVVALVPSDVVWEGWGPGVAPGRASSFSWRGQGLPFVPYKDFEKELAGFATGAEVRIRRPQDAGRAANPERVAAARIPVEDIAAPVFVAGADDDQVWDSGGMARNIAAARSRAGRETVTLVFRDAGHALGSPGTWPTTQYNAGPSKAGGNPEADARAQAQVWAAQFEFLGRVLGPPR